MNELLQSIPSDSVVGVVVGVLAFVLGQLKGKKTERKRHGRGIHSKN